MHRSVYVQDERYNTGARMHRSAYVQNERYDVVAWMQKNADVKAKGLLITSQIQRVGT
jgi:hypothetical protein